MTEQIRPDDRIAFVYRLTNTVTGKQYIGICASKVQRRWRRHCNSAWANKARNRNCPALHAAIRKYGESVFEIETLYRAVNWLEACRVERGLIAQYGTMAPNGYNLTSGGEGTLGHKMSVAECERRSAAAKGKVLTPQHRAKIGMANKGKKRAPELAAIMRDRMNQWREAAGKITTPARQVAALRNLDKARISNIGRHPPEETRAKMGAWQIGKKLSAETKEKIAAKARQRRHVDVS